MTESPHQVRERVAKVFVDSAEERADRGITTPSIRHFAEAKKGRG